jgi:hypothetical protein
MFRRPSFGFAEVAWHWSFGAAVVSLITFCFIEYLDSLPVSAADLVLLQSNRKALISRAISDIVHGSAPRLVQCAVLIAGSLAIVWIVLASVGRGVITRALLTDSNEVMPDPAGPLGSSFRFRSLVGINFLRVTITIAAVVGSVVPWFFRGVNSPSQDRSVAGELLGFLLVITLVWLAWYLLNWVLSLAALFVVAENRNTFGAIRSAVRFSCDHVGPVLASNAWFDFAHVLALLFAVPAAIFTLSLLAVLPPGFALIGALLVLLAYFFIVDFLRIGRLAAYVAILRGPAPPMNTLSIPANPGSGPRLLPGGVDPDELILSDIPLPAH